MLYTGLMYQLMPSMIALGKLLALVEDSPLTRLFGAGRQLNRVLDVSRLIPLLLRRADQDRFDGILRRIASLLQTAGVEFGYLYEQERYAGALAHDNGLCATFERHARSVRALLRRHGIRRVITVDPHTTNVLRSVYPKVLGRDGLEVRSYLEVLAETAWRPAGTTAGSVVIHDSCVYARHESVVEQPRSLLARAGVGVTEPEHSRTGTFCCGGPIESLFPGKARAIAETRLGQLAAAGSRVVTMCPVCFVNLGQAATGRAVSVEDISGWLAGPPGTDPHGARRDEGTDARTG